MTPAQDAAPALRLRDLTVGYDRRAVVRDVSLDVAPRERVALVGASGAGKSTLLRTIAGLLAALGGRVEIAGRDVGAEPPERRDAVYLHQTPTLFPHLSVFENVAFPLRLRRVADPELRERVRGALHAVRLDAFTDRPPRSLSGGQRSRVALARAIVARPALLLLDEPLSALDPALKDEVAEAVVAVQDEHAAAALLVTHDFEEAGLLGHRVGVIVDGALAQLSPPAELFHRPTSLAVARFLGVPNEVRGRVLEDGSFESMLGRLPHLNRKAPRPGAAVAVFHADACRLDPDGTPARVTRLLHRGHHVTARVATGGGELELAVDGLAPPEVGASVAFSVDPARVNVFPV